MEIVYYLRLYNVPHSKCHSDLVNEFLARGLAFSSMSLEQKPDGSHSGCAVIEFHTESDLETFTKSYPRLRKNISIYKSYPLPNHVEISELGENVV